MSVELVIGGARSGKSRYAEMTAKHSGKSVTYIATSEVRDEEMAKRVDMHKKQRPSEWQVIEEPYQLSKALIENSTTENCILVDCLTLWLSNCLFGDSGKSWESYKNELLVTLTKLPGQVILVTNEVGCGVIPMGKESREYVDQAGWLHQSIAEKVAKVTLVTAGLPLQLKS